MSLRMLPSKALPGWADRVLAEVEADTSEWFWPKTNAHAIFEQAYMKFVNRNLNYFSFKNMIAQTMEKQEFHPAFDQTLRFCRFTRMLSPDHIESPFGRMCVWKMPPHTALLPHRDNYFYHRFIVRNIFVFSEHEEGKVTIKIRDKAVPITKGLLFQFDPAYDKHEFVNDDDKPLYFLGFDFWIRSKLQALLSLTDVPAVQAHPDRVAPFTGPTCSAKYISEH